MQELHHFLCDRSSEVTQRIKRFNISDEFDSRQTTPSLHTFDVKTLYTNIPHVDLIEKLHSLIDDISCLHTPAYTGVEVTYLCVKWVNITFHISFQQTL